VFVQDRRARLEVGYGLEPVLPDAAAGQVIREALAPRFREGRYAAGLEAAVDAVFARVETRGVAPAPRDRFGGSPWVLGLFVVFGIVALLLARDAAGGGRPRRHAYTAGGRRRGWDSPAVVVPPIFGGWGGGGRGGWGGGGGGFSAGGGSFGGGGASGDW
jgi:uncharacterized protein